MPKTTRKAKAKPAAKKSTKRAGAKPKGARAATRTKKPRLLAGGNPQIAKGDGDAPVQAYIAAVPGWRSAACKRLDRLIERTVPGVKKAVLRRVRSRSPIGSARRPPSRVGHRK